MRQNGLPKPNTNQELKGKNPRAYAREHALKFGYCDNCRSRWTEEDEEKTNGSKVIHVPYCARCVGKRVAAAAMARRRKNPNIKKRDRNPYWLDLTITPGLRGGYDLEIETDIGPLLKIRNLKHVSVRDASEGKAKVKVVGAKQPPVQTVTPAGYTRAADKAKGRGKAAKPVPSRSGKTPARAYVN